MDITAETQALVRTVDLDSRRASLVRIQPNAGFVSQLIAERDRLPIQRERRRAPLITAIAAYATGERRDARRLPQGFFRSAEA